MEPEVAQHVDLLDEDSTFFVEFSRIPMNKTIAAILFLWAGLSLGVASIATPAKFLAPSLPMVQVLDVGRWTFPVLALIEWGLVVVVAVLVAIAWRSGTPCIGLVARLLAVIASVLAAQSFVLRPLLVARVLRIIAGESVPPSQVHNLYLALEAVLLVLILAVGIFSIRHLESDQS
jgi:hypothetical protein